MKDVFKRMLSRPIQLACYAVMGIATQHLLPKEPDALQWVAYTLIYISMLVLGLDSYTEGVERGIKIMDRLDGRP